MVEQQQQQQLNIPSTQSLVTGLDKAKNVAAVSAEQAPVSQRGQLLASDTADVITSAQQLLVNKNADDKLQRVAAQALDLGKEQISTTAGAGPSVGGIVGSQIPQQQTQQLREAITNLRDVTMLLIRSGQFRQLIFDSIRLFGITVQRAGERKQQGKPITGEQYEPNVPLSDEEKQQLDDRLRSLLRTLSQHEQYNRAINILFDLIGSVQQQGSMVGSSIVNDTRMQSIMGDSQALFGEFVGHSTLQTFLDVAKALINEIRSDAQLRMVFSNLRSSVNDAIQNPDAFYDDQIRRDQLRNQFYQARDILNSERFRIRARQLQDLSQQMFDNFRRDEDLVSFRNKVSRLVSDFALDQQGRPDLFIISESLQQLRLMLVPALSEGLRQINLPAFENMSENGKYRYRVEELSLTGMELLPENFQLEMYTGFGMKPRVVAADYLKVDVKLKITQMKPILDNFAFQFDRLRFPKWSDAGRASFAVLGDGLSLSARWRFKKSGDRFTLKLKDLDVDLDKIKLTIHEARHAMIDRVAKTLFKGAIRSRIELALETKLRQILLQVDQTFNDSVLNNRQWIQQATVRANEQLKTGFERGGVIKEKVQQGLSNLGSNVQQGISNFSSGTTGVASTGPIGTTSAGIGMTGTSNLGVGTSAGTIGFQKPIVGTTGFTGTTPQGSNV